MTKAEIVKLLAVISAAYPNMQITEATVNLWHELLNDVSLSLALAAAKKLILESPYPPTIADIRKRVVEVAHPQQLNAAEAWGEVTKAMRFYGYYRANEAIASMSKPTARTVEYIGWANICTCEEPGVIRGQFMKMYEQVAGRERNEALLPASLKAEMKKITALTDRPPRQ